MEQTLKGKLIDNIIKVDAIDFDNFDIFTNDKILDLIRSIFTYKINP